eukprot:15343411-Ditylum_brightwellii.AAC.1
MDYWDNNIDRRAAWSEHEPEDEEEQEEGYHINLGKTILASMGDVLLLPNLMALVSNGDSTDSFNMISKLDNCFKAVFAAQQNTLLDITPSIAGIQNASRTALSRVKKQQDLIKVAWFLHKGKEETLAGVLSSMSSALVREGLSARQAT